MILTYFCCHPDGKPGHRQLLNEPQKDNLELSISLSLVRLSVPPSLTWPKRPESPALNPKAEGDVTMRFMIIVRADKNTEAGVMPSEKLLTDMGKYNEELVKAGVLLGMEGLQPSSKGARVRFSGAKRTVIDGPSPRPRADSRLLAVPDEIIGRGDRMGQALPES